MRISLVPCLSPLSVIVASVTFIAPLFIWSLRSAAFIHNESAGSEELEWRVAHAGKLIELISATLVLDREILMLYPERPFGALSRVMFVVFVEFSGMLIWKGLNETVEVGDGVGLGVGDGLGDDVGLGVGDGVGVGVGLGDGVGVGVGDGVGLDVGVGLGDGVGVGVGGGITLTSIGPGGSGSNSQLLALSTTCIPYQ